MSDKQQSPITRADVDAEEKSKPAGAHGNPGSDGEHVTGASMTRRGPDRIEPSEDVQDD